MYLHFDVSETNNNSYSPEAEAHIWGEACNLW